METLAPQPKLISLRESLRGPVKRALFRLMEKPAEQLLALDRFNQAYADTLRRLPDSNYLAAVLDTFQIRVSFPENEGIQIPEKGPLVIVSNHPFGGIEGVVLAHLAASARPDVKILGNHLLNHIAEMRPWVIAVNPFGGKKAARENIAPMRACLQWLKQGGALVVFPSGTVSHFQLRRKRIEDPPWNENVAALIRHSRAAVLPVFVEGRNSSLFQAAGLLHPCLRTFFLPREMVKKMRSVIRLRAGNPIPWSRLKHFENDRDRVNFLRLNTYILKNRNRRNSRFFFPAIRRIFHFPAPRLPIIPALDPALLREEIAALPPEQRLVSQGDFDVYCAGAARIPNVLREIGRLREKTFREAGEGSGRDCDLDEFDSRYLHLFLWNRRKEEVAGAYRMGLTDEIFRSGARRGLYTQTLFKLSRGFLMQIHPALEMGRSFIRSEYQRKHTSLALLWRGIGEFVVRHPRYRILFGPVSISAGYQPLSKNLIIQFLKRHTWHREWSRMVKPKHPHRARRLRGLDKKLLLSTVKHIDEVSALVSEIESDGKGAPVLLRHYLKLNGLMLSFNLDTRFSRVVDGLVLVDLTRADPKILRRYLGAEGLRSYLEHHQGREAAAPRPVPATAA